MSKELFVKVINFMKELHIESEKYNNLMQEVDPEFGGGYIHTKTISFLEELLKELSNDVFNEIGYFLWELDFGSKYEDGCITGPEGEIIKLSSPEELYDLIGKDNK